VLRVEHVECVHPSANDVWLEQVSIGVNYLDVTQRSGAVPIPLPSGLGLEGAGRVAAVGAAVRDIVVGDRVAYVLGPIGSYAGARLYPAGRLIKLSDTVAFDDAFALLFKGSRRSIYYEHIYRAPGESCCSTVRAAPWDRSLPLGRATSAEL
jgi:NADPH:quinone reductase